MAAGTLSRLDPLSEFGDLRNSLDRLLGDWLDGHDRARTPEMDVLRDGDEMIVRANMPGIKPDEVKIEVQDNVLTFSGTHEETMEEKDEHYVRRERRYGSFFRTVPLPAGVDANAISASAHDGVVEIKIPLPKERKPEAVTITPTAG